MARGPKITREDQSILKTYESNSILDEYISIMEKNAVKAYNPYAEIKSLFNPKSKYRTVDEAVKDMQDRSGLAKYLTSVKTSIDKQNSKVASTVSTNTNYISPMEAVNGKSKVPEIVKKYPGLDEYIDAIAKQYKGTISVPAVQEHIKNKLNSDDSVYTQELEEYIHSKISEYKEEKQHNMSFGNPSEGGLTEASGDLFETISPTVENK